MKKLLSVMMILLITVSSVFAATGYIGASSGFGFEFTEDAKNTSTYFPVSVDGATYFGRGDFGLGFSYGAEIAYLPFQGKLGNITQDLKPLENYEWTLAPYAGLGFQYRFNKSIGLAGSVNATLNWDKGSYTLPIIGTKVEGYYLELGMMGNLFLNINMGSFNLRAGGLMGGPIGNWVIGKAGSTSITSDMYDIMGPFHVAPFVGIGFAY